MLTGDREETAARVAKELSLDGWRAELLPGDKVDALREICGGDTKKTIYVGDGVNDGPVLVTSETGIAMGGFGSQVAVEAADAVILDDSPAKVADLLRIAKKTRAIVWQNVALALGVKGVFLVLGASGHAASGRPSSRMSASRSWRYSTRRAQRGSNRTVNQKIRHGVAFESAPFFRACAAARLPRFTDAKFLL